MRVRVTQQGKQVVTVNAVAGTYVVLLGMEVSAEASKGLLGFALHRTDKTSNEQYWLRGFKTFEASEPYPAPGTLVSTQEHPVQGFLWGDYTAKANNEYVYKVVPVYGTPRNLKYGPAVDVAIKTENEDNGTHAIYFNRGVAGSQAYVRKFGDKSPEIAGPEAYKWLSRGAEEAILAFINKAKGKRYAIRAAAYEFSHKAVLAAFGKAAASGADVKIVYDCRKEEPQASSNKAIAAAKIKALMIPRTANPSYIAHNKFIVLLKDGVPVEVLTGSTNFTDGGIYGQSNVVHIVRLPELAAQYLAYWERLSEDTPAAKLRPLNLAQTPDPEGVLPGGVHPVFSPRPSLNALQWYSGTIDQAKVVAGFSAAFGVNAAFAEVLQRNKNNLRYVLLEKPGPTYAQFEKVKNNLIAIGAVLDADVVGDSKLQHWVAEKLSGLNGHVNYIHTKYLFVDPMGELPTVISGSANFSDASTTNNDENMLIVQGDYAVADIYLGEFMRLWNHFHFRDVAKRYAIIDAQAAQEQKKTAPLKNPPYLTPDDSWIDVYGKSYAKAAERKLLSNMFIPNYPKEA